MNNTTIAQTFFYFDDGVNKNRKSTYLLIFHPNPPKGGTGESFTHSPILNRKFEVNVAPEKRITMKWEAYNVYWIDNTGRSHRLKNSNEILKDIDTRIDITDDSYKEVIREILEAWAPVIQTKLEDT